MAAGELVDVDVSSLAPGGDAVGRQRGGKEDGRVVFVPLAAPGEFVRARVVRQNARTAWAELIDVVKPSTDRVPPLCPLFGTCGGCQWQHVTRGAQLSAKKAIVERALGIPVDIVAVGPAFGYRDRVRLAVGTAANARADRPVGFRGRRSHDVVDVTACPLVSPALADVWLDLRVLARRHPEGTQIVAQAGRHGKVLASAGGQAVSFGSASEPELTIDVAEGEGPSLAIGPGGFSQVGSAANEALVAAVMAAVGDDPGNVLELFAGAGNFTRHLVARARSVSAHDGDARAREHGRANVAGAIWMQSVEAAASALASLDLVLCDPPRQGLDAAALAVVGRARHRIVYVSCDPQTLRRDVRLLAQSGWRLDGATALDLMPQTFHVEVVARLRQDI